MTGGNVGNRLVNLQHARDKIQEYAGEVLKESDIYETAAWGFLEQPSFLNQVLLISTHFKAEELLEKLLMVELELGRKRIQKMGPRTIDIDILFYNNEIISSPNLTIPHPQIANRRFVLTPLNEIASDFVHPIFKKTVGQLLAVCADGLEVLKYQPAENT